MHLKPAQKTSDDQERLNKYCTEQLDCIRKQLKKPINVQKYP